MSAVSVLHEEIQPADYVQARRPWLALYGVRLRPKVQAPAIQVELAPIQHLPDEVIHLVLSEVGSYALGSVACTCRAWRILSEHPKLWQQACREALAPNKDLTPEGIQKLLKTKYHGSWKRMFLHHPHLRFDGVFVSRNTYVRTGLVEFNARKAVHLVAYYRYYRFFPDGTLLYRTSPMVPAKVCKALRNKPKAPLKRDENLYLGKYCVKGNTVYCLVVYPNSRSTEIRARLAMRSTHPGANNRLDIKSIASFDHELGTSSDLAAPVDPSEEVDAAEGSKEYRRGLAPLVFVPWEQVQSTPLNLPVEQMDFYFPG